jgi:hypothetical protein
MIMNIVRVSVRYEVCPSATLLGARGGVVVKTLATNRQVAGSNPDGVVGIFQ